MSEAAEAVATLRDAATIRERCVNLFDAVAAGASPHFTLDLTQLDAAAARVAALARQRFPDGRIPMHSRWRHFEAGGVDRKADVDAALAGCDAAERARVLIDLTLVSVLLDAGAGTDWSYTEVDGGCHARSEGLAVASLRAFLAGRFSSNAKQPCRVDADALSRIDAAVLAGIFQAGPGNPLVGLGGRAALLRRLGDALRSQPEAFGTPARPGRLYDLLTRDGARAVDAATLLRTLLDALSGVWPSGQRFDDGTPLGDAWRHPLAGGSGASAGWVPFHKLSQWLTYSLLEPFEWAGVAVTHIDALTGLPEYRNGGLLLDAGVIVPRDAQFAARHYAPLDTWVIEWRALTVALLDRVAQRVRERLGLSAAQMPLARVLEAGTWAAGRQIAAEQRTGGVPPVHIDSDGTVF